MTFIYAFLLLALSSAHATDLDALQSEYRQACGGKIYSKCDGENGRSQLTLFQAAVEQARASRRRVLVIYGADWCPPCVVVDRLFKSLPDFKRQLETGYVLVDINADVDSGRKIKTDLRISSRGIPTFIVYDPETQRARQVPGENARASLLLLLEGEFPVTPEAAQPSKLGPVRMSVVDTPIRQTDAIVGNSRLEISTRLRGQERERLQVEVRRAFDLLHGFDYLNSARAARAALEIEADNPVVLTLFGLAASELEQGDPDFSFQRFGAAWKSAQTFPLDDADRAFVSAIYGETCAMRPDGCGNARLLPVPRSRTLERALKHSVNLKLDYEAYLAFRVWDTDRLKRLGQTHPEMSAVHHYLTHVFESAGQMNEALEQARLYKDEASGIPHAQHMYGHILPQVGRWQAAIAQFQLADELHKREFVNEGILPNEDWHYAHNLDLWTAALVHRGDVAGALKALPEQDVDGRPNIAFRRVSLQIAAGDYEGALRGARAIDGKLGATPGTRARRIQALLGLHRFADATREMDLARQSEMLDAAVMVGARLAYVATADGSPEPWFMNLAAKVRLAPSDSRAELTRRLGVMLSAKGFDNWSNAAIERAALARVLRDTGHADVAVDVDALPTASADRVCPEDSICHPKK